MEKVDYIVVGAGPGGCATAARLAEGRPDRTVAVIDHTLGQRCAALTAQYDMIRNSALFHWWPRPSQKN